MIPLMIKATDDPKKKWGAKIKEMNTDGETVTVGGDGMTDFTDELAIRIVKAIKRTWGTNEIEIVKITTPDGLWKNELLNEIKRLLLK
jgi:hypothetical protein